MIDSRYITGFAIGAGLIFFGFVFAGTLDEFTLDGVRVWFDALSGWVAAAGALGVGLPTLRWMQVQAQSNRVRQTIRKGDEAAYGLGVAEFSALGDYSLDRLKSKEPQVMERIQHDLKKICEAMDKGLDFLDEADDFDTDSYRKLQRRLQFDAGYIQGYPYEVRDSDPSSYILASINSRVEAFPEAAEQLHEAVTTLEARCEARTKRLKVWLRQNTLPD